MCRADFDKARFPTPRQLRPRSFSKKACSQAFVLAGALTQ
jgi:hypothetical protein